MARQPGYYSSEDTPDEAFFLECGFKLYATLVDGTIHELEKEFRGGIIDAFVDIHDGSISVVLKSQRESGGVVRIFPKRDDGYVDCQDIVDLLMLLGVPCSVELH